MNAIGAALFVISLLTSPSTQAQSINAGLNQEEVAFQVLINRFRGLLGLNSLMIHPALQLAASQHSSWMAENDLLSHNGPTQTKTPFQRMEDAGYANATSMGENVACGNGDARRTFLQWAFSPGHLANMLSPNYRDMGIARRGTGQERCPFYWTHDFAATTNWQLDPPKITDTKRILDAIKDVAGPIDDVDTSVLSEVQ